MLLFEEIKYFFGSKQGTKVYAFAYKESRFEEAKTSKDGLYHFLLVIFT